MPTMSRSPERARTIPAQPDPRARRLPQSRAWRRRARRVLPGPMSATCCRSARRAVGATRLRSASRAMTRAWCTRASRSAVHSLAAASRASACLSGVCHAAASLLRGRDGGRLFWRPMPAGSTDRAIRPGGAPCDRLPCRKSRQASFRSARRTSARTGAPEGLCANRQRIGCGGSESAQGAPGNADVRR